MEEARERKTGGYLSIQSVACLDCALDDGCLGELENSMQRLKAFGTEAKKDGRDEPIGSSRSFGFSVSRVFSLLSFGFLG